MELYDAIIIGGGPCGVSAAIYLARSNKKVLILERSMIGGQVAFINEVYNYPGYTGGDGFGLCQNFIKQLKDLKVEVKFEEVQNLNLTDKIKTISTKSGTYQARTVILCLGAGSKKLGLDNEKDYFGKGISYCATCDGSLYKNKTVCVVGGGSSAFEEASYLSDIAKKVYLIVRRESFQAEASLVKALLTKKDLGKDIEILVNTTIEKIIGTDKVTKVVLKNAKDFSLKEVDVDGVFVAIGRVPSTEVLDNQVSLHKDGYIIVDENFSTNLAGVFAGGDVIVKNFRQIATAVADGALISVSIIKYLHDNP